MCAEKGTVVMCLVSFREHHSWRTNRWTDEGYTEEWTHSVHSNMVGGTFLSLKLLQCLNNPLCTLHGYIFTELILSLITLVFLGTACVQSRPTCGLQSSSRRWNCNVTKRSAWNVAEQTSCTWFVLHRSKYVNSCGLFSETYENKLI